MSRKSERGSLLISILAKADPLPTTFTCLFCNHEKSVTVKLDKKAGVGQLDCKICGQKFQCGINCTIARSVQSAVRWLTFLRSFRGR